MKATYKNIPTWYKEGTFSKENKKKLIDRYGLQDKSNATFKGYFLTDKLTEEEKKELLQKYDNIDLWETCYQYAPEIKDIVILICNHTLKKGRAI